MKREACLSDVPRPWAWVCHAVSLRGLRPVAASLVLGPPDTEWPLANPWEEPFGAKATRVLPLMGRSKQRRTSQPKTGRVR